MVAVKKAIQSWKRDVAVALGKPRLILPIIVIGFFMMWLASEQVRVCLRFLIHCRLADEEHSNKLRERYLLFGLSILGFLWLDLMLLNFASTFIGAGYRYVEHRLMLCDSTPEKDVATPDEHPKRRNAVRTCRRDALHSEVL